MHTRYLISLLLLQLAILTTAPAQDMYKKPKTTYGTNTFTLTEFKYDTLYPRLPDGRTNCIIKVTDPVVLTMNGARIYNLIEVSTTAKNTTARNLELYLLSGLAPVLSQLEDGKYRLEVNNIVIDKTGKIAYHYYKKFYGFDMTDTYTYVADNLKTQIEAETDKLMQKANAFVPATYNGKNVASIYPTTITDYEIRVQNARVTWEKRPLKK